MLIKVVNNNAVELAESVSLCFLLRSCGRRVVVCSTDT
jgi:hypothetical protein